MLSYRMNRKDETAAALLDPARQDGWVVGGDREQDGLAVCRTVEALAEYAQLWGMGAEQGDHLVEIVGGMDLGQDEPPARRLLVTSTTTAETIAVVPRTMGNDELAEWLLSEPWNE